MIYKIHEQNKGDIMNEKIQKTTQKETTQKETTQNNTNNKKKITSKQVVALAGVVLLVLMYVVTLIMAFADSSASGKYFAVCLACTLVVPIVIWIYSWMYGRITCKKVLGDPENEEIKGEE